MKILKSIHQLGVFLLIMTVVPVLSAQNSGQVIIIEEYTDENGEKQTKKTIKEWDGEDEMNSFLQEHMPKGFDMRQYFEDDGGVQFDFP